MESTNLSEIGHTHFIPHTVQTLKGFPAPWLLVHAIRLLLDPVAIGIIFFGMMYDAAKLGVACTDFLSIAGGTLWSYLGCAFCLAT